MRRVVRGSLGALLAAVTCGVVVGQGERPASAAAPVPVTFTSTGAEQVYDIPQGVAMLHVLAVGGRGAERGNPLLGLPGFGAIVTADVPVPVGVTQLFVEVGGNGTEWVAGGGGEGGWNGGGDAQGLFAASSGGGGASDLRTCSQTASSCSGGGTTLDSRLVVAGGGGGGGGPGGADDIDTPGLGGHGGDAGGPGGIGLDGGDGKVLTNPDFAGGGGGGGGATAIAGGSAGGAGQYPGCVSGGPGDDGSGGSGGVSGGGGGWFGGGGGGSGAVCPDGDGSSLGGGGGGGGGSSHVVADATNVSFATDTTGIGTITITPGPRLTPALLPDPTFFEAYSQQLSVDDDGTPVAATFTVSAGTLPPGLTLSPSGLIAGAPTLGGFFTFTVDATDENQVVGRQSYSVHVTVPDVEIRPTSLPDGPQEVPYEQQLGAFWLALGPQPNTTFTLVEGAPPPGITMSSTGTLIGAPTTVGTFGFTVQATIPFFGDIQQSFSIEVQQFAVTPINLPAGHTGTAYSEQLGVVHDGSPVASADFELVDGPLPPGLTLSATGLIAGTPTVADPYPFTVAATVTGVGTVRASYTLDISGLLVTPSSLPPGPVNESYFEQVGLALDDAPVAGATFSLTSGALPPGLTLESFGPITGFPTTPGAYAFTISGRAPSGDTASRDYEIVVTTPAEVFSWLGANEQRYIVVPGTRSLRVQVIGADGADAGQGAVGGDGAVVVAELPVPPGATELYVTVGGNGTGQSGTNGGQPEGGGGASDIRTCSNLASSCPGGGTSLASRLVVAGGGGAAGLPGASHDGFPAGGDGGSAGGTGGLGAPGTAGQSITGAGAGAAGAGGGASVAGGGGAAGAACAGGVAGAPGDAGSEGTGGAPGGGGGGAGGGWFGGGGGGGGGTCIDDFAQAGSGGGGGGSSYVSPSATSSSISTSSDDTNQVTITPIFGAGTPAPDPGPDPGGPPGPGSGAPGSSPPPEAAGAPGDPAQVERAGASSSGGSSGGSLALTGAGAVRLLALVGTTLVLLGIALVFIRRLPARLRRAR
jgi:hypothetical protein